MELLPSVKSPSDLRRISEQDLPLLAAEIREFLIRSVAKTGGHLGPNLGVVELTIALHRVFDSPHEPIVFDVGHQAYVHKILTGRQSGFDKLRSRGGISGYPRPVESAHDWSENSHASAALSYVDGLSKAYELSNDPRPVVAVVGDGALTGGMCWEALNNIAAARRPVVIVINDNGRSYAPTIGAIATKLAELRLKPNYESALDRMRGAISSTPVIGPVVYDALHGIKAGIKDMVSPQGMFADLGIKYVGPVDGHQIGALETALRAARDFGGPVIVHCKTRKGFGYAPAENHQEDLFHGPGPFSPQTGQILAKPSVSWTDVFAQELAAIGADRDDVVAITAAMLHPCGLATFSEQFPERTFDVGIAEQHAMTSAAGLAMGGQHPVVALYATFLNRAFDQFVMDIALQRLPVTLCLDRAGITGPDGPSHNGVWDLAILNAVPGVRIAAPRDGQTLRAQLREAIDIGDGPTVLRWSKGTVNADLEAEQRTDDFDILTRGAAADVAIVTVGPMAQLGVEAAELLATRGISATVIDPRWVLPVTSGLCAELSGYQFLATVEDGLRQGGVGSAICQALSDTGSFLPSRQYGVSCDFPEHGTRTEVLKEFGLTAEAVAEDIASCYARIHGPRDVSAARGRNSNVRA